ncbi:ATP-grasp domain-containing protein [Winogradskyella endarachnes]|uniref:ATP-grasp domain-containing protein n=1 Tax=Winogradskyella endarachnes TaxID=2681965 RepID=A0A6L6U5B0_9FLAO|nr:ATP-grasp domain-containing protein [Winogradskyella endarachnes]MUU77331.1 ATP-grasp domain-containing protein [Winogradskyella endarachnes]
MNEGLENFSILIPDSDDQKVLAYQVVNCLSFYKAIKIYIMSSNKNSHLRYSRRIKHFSYYPNGSTATWISNINKEVERHKIDLIMPIFDGGIARIIKNKSLLKDACKVCVLPSNENYFTAIDKGLLYRFLKINNLPCPESEITKPNELPNFNNLKFPIIAKPVNGYSGGNQIKILKNPEEVENYNKLIKYNCNVIYQNYVNGYDLCCNVLCDKGEIKAYSVQSTEKIEHQDLEPQTGFKFVDNTQLLEIIKKVMKGLEWSGVANIDCRYDKDDNSFKIIEINSRYWMNIDASSMAQVNFPYLHCLLTLNKLFDYKKAKEISYVNLRGLARLVSNKPATLLKVKYILHSTPLKFVFKDPIPMLFIYAWRTKKLLKAKFKN